MTKPLFPGHEKAFEALRLASQEAGEALRDGSLTLSVAESLTGGLITAALTAVPGSSDYLAGSVVAYSNQIKSSLLNVSLTTLEVSGAVSAQCSSEMARGVRAKLGTDLGLSSTGVAGPSGGSYKKPVGLVYLTVLDSNHSITVRRRFRGDRLAVTWQAALAALKLLGGFLIEPESVMEE